MPNNKEIGFQSFKMVGKYPVLILNKSLGSSIKIDISKRIINLFPKDCPLT